MNRKREMTTTGLSPERLARQSASHVRQSGGGLNGEAIQIARQFLRAKKYDNIQAQHGPVKIIMKDGKLVK